MAGFDDQGIFFGDDTDWMGHPVKEPEMQASILGAKKRFRDFLREFRDDNGFKYRDQIRQNYNAGVYFVKINMRDICDFDPILVQNLNDKPTEYIPLIEDAARSIADEVTRPRPDGDGDLHDMQVSLSDVDKPNAIRDLKSSDVSKLVKIPGIVIAASPLKAKAIRITIQCRGCRSTLPNLPVKPGLEGYAMPRKCQSGQAVVVGMPSCPLDPYFIMPDKCKCVDYQVLKLQESPEDVPNGEIPRHIQLYCDRNLTDKVVPGNRVTALGIYSIKKVSKPSNQSSIGKGAVGVRAPYIRVVGFEVDVTGPGRSPSNYITPEEAEHFRQLARQPDIYERISKSIAPSIYGSENIKKAIACLLLGGSRKRLPDGIFRRGDINVLLLGDPGTAKSQLLKFVERVAPVGVYTSGKGSSAAGLTASVLRDPSSRGFIIEGGAMVLADGGVVCIDEFDKMREDDRVAIHEAMEQQTISIAKAGITTTLNSRCSVLAAANSVFGRWDDTKGSDNIEFMPTILSRFDMIFIVKDEHNEMRDITLAKHVMNVHMNALTTIEDENEGELDLQTMKKFINFCRSTVGPRLSEAAGEKLANRYVLMRSGNLEQERKTGKRTTIPITVRQLEAIVRIAESLAKMQLQPIATEIHVDEALRLFQVSTLDAALSGTLSGAEGFTTADEQEKMNIIENQLKRRFAIGSMVSEQTILQDFSNQKYPEHIVKKVLYFMMRRGDLVHRMQRKMLIRVK